MKLLKILGIGGAVGFAIGWIWGLLEASGHLGVYFIQGWLKSGSPPPLSMLDFFSIALLAAFLYGLVLAVLSLVLAPAASLAGRLLPKRVSFTGPREAICTASLAAVLFFNLYWWTRPILFYGLRFHDPRRLAASGAFAVAAVVLAFAAVRLLRRVRFRASYRLVLGLALVVFLATALAGWKERASRAGPPPKTGKDWVNVVLVVPDALRADHLGCYGYHPYDRPVSPFLDRLAKDEAVLFEQAVTQAPYTWTSFGSFLTGKYPRKHGLLRMDPTQRLDPQDNVTLAEVLDGAGYECGAFLMGTLSHNSGLLQGFDQYFEALVGHDPVSVHSKWSIFKSDLVLMHLYNKIKQARDPALVNTMARRFVRESKDRPFFLMVHYYATHTPYNPPEPYKSMYDPDYEGPFTTFTQSHNFEIMEGKLSMNERDLRHIKALYDGGVTFVDQMVSDLYDTLKASGVLEKTLFIFISDHGEELYDHRVFEHDWMYNTNQLVPLIVRFPGGKFGGRRIALPVSLIDLVPTVLQVTGVKEPEAAAALVDGRSLLGALGEDGQVAGKRPRYSFCENNRYISVQDEAFKLIHYRWDDRKEPDRLFHIASDPGETNNVIDQFPEVAARLAAVLEEYDRSMPVESKTYQMDPELYDRLFRLGYIGGNIHQLEGELEKKDP